MADFIDLEAIAERLVVIKDRSALNAKDFCETTGIPPSSYSQIAKKQTKINIDTINKVVERWGEEFPPMWFLFGNDANSNDLFGNLSTPVSVREAIEADGANIENDTSGIDNRLQLAYEEIGRLKEALSRCEAREIQHITVFYKDKRVDNYKLDES